MLILSADGPSKEGWAVFLAARESFPNIILVVRDPAHAIRIGSTYLHWHGVFGQVWHALFYDRHTLAPYLMISRKWHTFLVAI